MQDSEQTKEQSFLNIYEVHHDGRWLGGKSIVVARDEDRALALTKFAMAEHGLSAENIHVRRKLNISQERCFVIDDGDY